MMRMETIPAGITIYDVVRMYPGISNHFDYGLLIIIQDIVNKLDATIMYGPNRIEVIDKYGNEHSTAEILLKGEEIYQGELNI